MKYTTNTTVCQTFIAPSSKPDLVTRTNCLGICRSNVCAKVVWLGTPQRVDDDLDDVCTLPGLEPGNRRVLPSLHCSKVGCGSCNIEALPVWDCEANWSGRVQGKPRQVESQAPVQDAMVW